jgi:threonine/homoserine/homoserine lactone efflux protein
VLSVLGNALGVGIQIIVVSFGLGIVIQQSPPVFFAIKIIGALMIGYLGIRAYMERGKLELADEASSSSSTVVKQSIVVGITNAKTFVFFIAALPSFVSPLDGNPTLQMLFLGLLFSVIGIASDMVYAISAGKARDWLSTSSERLARFRGAGGLALALLGLYMLADALII